MSDWDESTRAIPRFDVHECAEWTNMRESSAHELKKLVEEYGYAEILRTLGIWLEGDEL